MADEKFNSNCAISEESLRAAQWSAVRFCSSSARTLAFFWRSTSSRSFCPLPAARWRAVWPRESDWFTEQPDSNSNKTIKCKIIKSIRLRLLKLSYLWWWISSGKYFNFYKDGKPFTRQKHEFVTNKKKDLEVWTNFKQGCRKWRNGN